MLIAGLVIVLFIMAWMLMIAHIHIYRLRMMCGDFYTRIVNIENGLGIDLEGLRKYEKFKKDFNLEKYQ